MMDEESGKRSWSLCGRYQMPEQKNQKISVLPAVGNLPRVQKYESLKAKVGTVRSASAYATHNW